MRIGIFGGAVNGGTVDDVVSEARAAADDGFATYWSPQVFGLDALTALAVVAREVPGIELGTSVVPTYPRHPMALAQQARTVQQVSGDRLVLGVGLSHQVVIESMFHLSFARPARHMAEYLAALLPLLRGEPVDVRGDTVGATGALTIPAAAPVPVVVAALGPRMLELAGRLTDGTLTWCVGPETLAAFTAPTIRRAAEEAGRPAPRVIAGLPVCVTDDPAAVRERAARALVIYGQLPSYRAMLDREGVAGPEDLVIAGGEAEVHDRLAALGGAGVTDLAAVELGADPDERARTRAVLQSLC